MSALYLLLFFTFIFENQIEHTKIEQYLFLRIKLNHIIFSKKEKEKKRLNNINNSIHENFIENYVY